MKKILILLLLPLLAMKISAQTSDNAGDTKAQKVEDTFVEGLLNRLNEDVQLTKKQEEEVRQLLQTFYRDRDKAQKEADKSHKEKISKKKKIQDDYLQQLFLILTEEQQLQLQQKFFERMKAGLEMIKNLSDNSQES